MEEHSHEHKPRYTFSDFLPLIIIFAVIFGATFIVQQIYGLNVKDTMRIFMGIFFLVFGTFKLIKLKDFAQAYSEYDLIAKKFKVYGFIYPFLEILLGIAYLMNWNPTITNSVTLVLMLVSAAGVFNELRKGRTIVCACLGTVFKVPMTYVTLAEDLLMALMALMMLVMK